MNIRKVTTRTTHLSIINTKEHPEVCSIWPGVIFSLAQTWIPGCCEWCKRSIVHSKEVKNSIFDGESSSTARHFCGVFDL